MKDENLTMLRGICAVAAERGGTNLPATWSHPDLPKVGMKSQNKRWVIM